MKKLVLSLAILTGAALAGFVGGYTVTAHADEDHDTVAQAEQGQPQTQQPASYTYVAQPGDTYTHMARKALQTYGKIHTAEVSLAGVIFAETNLTQEAGSPLLNVGQEVKLDEQTVKNWFEQAQKLTSDQQSAWNYYVQFVDFNTDKVGQAG